MNSVAQTRVPIPTSWRNDKENKTGLLSFLNGTEKQKIQQKRHEGSNTQAWLLSLKKWGTQKSHPEDSSMENPLRIACGDTCRILPCLLLSLGGAGHSSEGKRLSGDRGWELGREVYYVARSRGTGITEIQDLAGWLE